MGKILVALLLGIVMGITAAPALAHGGGQHWSGDGENVVFVDHDRAPT